MRAGFASAVLLIACATCGRVDQTPDAPPYMNTAYDVRADPLADLEDAMLTFARTACRRSGETCAGPPALSGPRARPLFTG